MKQLAVAIAMSCSAAGIWFAVQAVYNPAEQGSVVAGDVRRTGAALRSDVENAYKEGLDTGRLKPGLRGLVITSVVTKWIPVGTTFDDAEKILKAAGFKVSSRPSEQSRARDPRPEHPALYCVDASARLDRGLFQTVDVIVMLEPENHYQYTIVHDVDAGIFVNGL